MESYLEMVREKVRSTISSSKSKLFWKLAFYRLNVKYPIFPVHIYFFLMFPPVLSPLSNVYVARSFLWAFWIPSLIPKYASPGTMGPWKDPVVQIAQSQEFRVRLLPYLLDSPPIFCKPYLGIKSWRTSGMQS